MEPSSTDLKYFLEVVREGNMSRAANKIGISQPSLSLAIQRIEKALGEVILLRDRTGAKPTAAGISLVKQTQRLFEVWENVRNITKKSSLGTSTLITLGCHPEVAIDSLPLFLPKLLTDYPELKIELKHDLSRIITEQVIEGKIDIGIVVNPKPFPDLVIKNLSQDEMGLWVARTRKNDKHIDTLICQPELPQTQKIIKQASKIGMSFNRIISSSDIEVICALVSSGCGVGILPSEVALRNPAHELVAIGKSPKVIDKVALIYRQENRSSRMIKAIVPEIINGHQQKYGKIQN